MDVASPLSSAPRLRLPFICRIFKSEVFSFIGDLSGAVNIVVPFNLTGQAEVQAEGLSVHLDSSVCFLTGFEVMASKNSDRIVILILYVMFN